MKDSFGVPLEPDYKPIGVDWNEQDLFSGDEIYVTDYGYVRTDDVDDFMDAVFMKTTIDEENEIKRGNL